MKFYVTSKLSENMHETPEGYLVCLGVPIARTGEMVYSASECPLEPDENGRVLITREEAEVFRAETIASFQGKAVTITHPEEFVGPENWKELSKGILQNVRRGEGDQNQDLVADLLIMDAIAIGSVKNGLREVSCGYEADYVQTAPGRGIQRNIVGNHLALVEQGRAGTSYAINDHKGDSPMKLSEKIKAIFAKAQDEALKVADAEGGKEDKSGEVANKEAADANAYDAMMNMIKDLSSKMDKMMPKDAGAEQNPASGAPAQPVAKDEDPAAAGSGLEDRLKALEAAVSKLMERESKEDEVSMDEDSDEEGEESEDDGEEVEGEMVGDSAARIEILAPGLKASTKDAKVKALQACYATKDGKAVIEALTGGKAPAFDKPEQVSTLFVAASEVLKVQRAGELADTKRTSKETRDFQSNLGTPKGAMTPEEINARNAKHYAQKA